MELGQARISARRALRSGQPDGPCPMRRRPRLSAMLAGLAAALALAACADVDLEQLRICERLIPAIEAPGAAIEVAQGTTDPGIENAVRLEYRLGSDAEAAHWISCQFGGRGFERDRLRLIGVVTDREGALSEIRVFLLRRYWLDLYEAQASSGGRTRRARTFLVARAAVLPAARPQRHHGRLLLWPARDRLHPGLCDHRPDQSGVRRDRDGRRVHHVHRRHRARARGRRRAAARPARGAAGDRRGRGGARSGHRAPRVPAAARGPLASAADRHPRPRDLSPGSAPSPSGGAGPLGAADLLQPRTSWAAPPASRSPSAPRS